jgi:hypothetical protein
LAWRAVSVPLDVFGRRHVVAIGWVHEEQSMEAHRDVESYRSPRTKLLRFFVRSRDGWKQKCQVAKLRIKRLSNRLQKLKVSRDRWKEQYRTLSNELQQIQEELQRLKNSIG